MNVVNKTRLIILLMCYALVHLVFHPGTPFRNTTFERVSSEMGYVCQGLMPSSQQKPIFAIRYRRGVEENPQNHYKNYKPLNNYVIFFGSSKKLSYCTRHLCSISDKLPGTLFSYYPQSLRAPPVC